MSDKYPRTFHLPNSPGATNDDKKLTSVNGLLFEPLIITEKLDGSNVCLTSTACYSRSHSGPPTHESFDQFKSLHASIKHLIPNNIQIFGEWCFAVHSLKYDKLINYLNIFAIKDLSNNEWLSWEEVNLWSDELKIPTVPLLFQCDYIMAHESTLKDIIDGIIKMPSHYGAEKEGFVIRISRSFKDIDFSKHVAKWVRANHVQTTEHWKDQIIVKNGIIK